MKGYIDFTYCLLHSLVCVYETDLELQGCLKEARIVNRTVARLTVRASHDAPTKAIKQDLPIHIDKFEF
jgi:hypothetical protein